MVAPSNTPDHRVKSMRTWTLTSMFTPFSLHVAFCSLSKWRLVLYALCLTRVCLGLGRFVEVRPHNITFSSLTARVCRNFDSCRLATQTFRKRNSHKEGNCGSHSSKLDLFDSNQHSMHSAQRQIFDNRGRFSRAMDRALAPFTKTSQCTSKSFTPEGRGSRAFCHWVKFSLLCSSAFTLYLPVNFITWVK